MASEKRLRQKANKQAAIDAVEKSDKQNKQRKNLIRVAIAVVALVAFLYFNQPEPTLVDSEAPVSTTTVTTLVTETTEPS